MLVTVSLLHLNLYVLSFISPIASLQILEKKMFYASFICYYIASDCYDQICKCIWMPVSKDEKTGNIPFYNISGVMNVSVRALAY